jgi:ribonuclease HII
VAAAVVFDSEILIPGLNDSKLLSGSQRLKLIPAIIEKVAGFSIAAVSNTLIDKINILQATLLAMRRAIEDLTIEPDIIYVDGNIKIPGIKLPQKAIVGGDRLFPQIMAASILAKVARDNYMICCSKEYPEYGFENHKGYGTAEHFKVIRRYGPCPIHRYSFNPISQFEMWKNDGITAK